MLHVYRYYNYNDIFRSGPVHLARQLSHGHIISSLSGTYRLRAGRSFGGRCNTEGEVLASIAPDSRDWLLALPITSCGLRLDDEAVRVAVGKKLGLSLCVTHKCTCGAEVDAEARQSPRYGVQKGPRPNGQTSGVVWHRLPSFHLCWNSGLQRAGRSLDTGWSFLKPGAKWKAFGLGRYGGIHAGWVAWRRQRENLLQRQSRQHR